jgi:hypothetical protein
MSTLTPPRAVTHPLRVFRGREVKFNFLYINQYIKVNKKMPPTTFFFLNLK